MLPSCKTLDLVDIKSDERKMVEKSQGKIELSHKLNLASSIFNQGEMSRAKNIPSAYNSFKPKPTLFQNYNNRQVMSGRLNTYSSSGF